MSLSEVVPLLFSVDHSYMLPFWSFSGTHFLRCDIRKREQDGISIAPIDHFWSLFLLQWLHVSLVLEFVDVVNKGYDFIYYRYFRTRMYRLEE